MIKGFENHFLIGHLGFLEIIVHIYEFKLNFTLFEGCRLTPPFQQPCKKKMLICKEIILCKKISSFSFVGVGDFPKGFMHCTQCKIKYKC